VYVPVLNKAIRQVQTEFYSVPIFDRHSKNVTNHVCATTDENNIQSILHTPLEVDVVQMHLSELQGYADALRMPLIVVLDLDQYEKRVANEVFFYRPAIILHNTTRH
jgi:phosphoribosylanthranilate isomerase